VITKIIVVCIKNQMKSIYAPCLQNVEVLKVKGGDTHSYRCSLKSSDKLLLNLQETPADVCTCAVSNMNFLVRRFSRLEFSAQLRISEMSRVECWKLSDVSAIIAFAIFRANVYEYDSCSVFRNVGYLSTFDAAHSRKPMLYNMHFHLQSLMFKIY
jgi:hypothetical protein